MLYKINRKKLAEAQLDLGMTDKELAELSCVNVRTVRRMASGCNVTSRVLECVSKSLRIHPLELASREM